jgi:hypothetical protein
MAKKTTKEKEIIYDIRQKTLSDIAEIARKLIPTDLEKIVTIEEYGYGANAGLRVRARQGWRDELSLITKANIYQFNMSRFIDRVKVVIQTGMPLLEKENAEKKSSGELENEQKYIVEKTGFSGDRYSKSGNAISVYRDGPQFRYQISITANKRGDAILLGEAWQRILKGEILSWQK